MTKEELRKIYIQKRSSLSDSEYLELNQRLCGVFFASTDLSKIKILHTFIPIERNKEPDTGPILSQIREDYPAINIVVPRVNNSTNSLENIFLESATVLKTNNWGIPEPQAGTAVDAQRIDMILAPMLIFDRAGHRVGYGKGFYDRLIASSRPGCKKIGLCLFDPVDRIEDIQPFDEPLDQCVTPRGSHTF